jgi:TolA-binding protein
MKPHFKNSVIPVSLLIIVLFLVTKSPTRAAAGNNPIFATIQYVQNAISTALSPIQSSVQELSNRVSNLEATVTPIPGQIADLQSHQSQIDQQITTLSQQTQALSASISGQSTTTLWDIKGTYTLRLFPIYDFPDSRIITITTVDPVTGQFSGTGSHGGSTLTINGIVNGSQFTLQTQTADSIVDIQAQGSISPDGKLWGVGTRSDGHGFVMTTLSGAATKKN